MIGRSVRDDQVAAVQKTSARVNNVRDVALPLVFIGFDKGFPHSADDLGGIITIEQEGANGILPHRAHSVTEHEPAGFSFNRRTAVSHLDEFPGESWPQNQFLGSPEVQMVGEHQVDVLVVLPAQHRVESLNLPRKERHAFVFDGRAVQRDEFEMQKIGCFEELGLYFFAIIGRESRVISARAIVILKKNKASILDSVALRQR